WRDEAGALLVRRQRDGAGGVDRGLCRRRREDDEPDRTGEISVPARLPDVGVSAGVRGLCDSRGPVAVSYLGADGSRGGANGGFDVARKRGDEAGSVWLFARGDDVVSPRIGGLEFWSDG